jgi:hypothetical protein
VGKLEARAVVLSRVEIYMHIRIIYASTRSGDGLRRVAVRLCADHSEHYVLQGGMMATRVFKLMDEVPAFRLDFITELALRLK